MKRKSPFLNFLFGKPLASSKDRSEKVGILSGIPIFGLDALGSTVYGPEAALTILLPVGLAGVTHIVPITICIVLLIAVLFFSYLQTIKAYPNGGGSYTVTKENLGTTMGLFAGIALMIDYILVVAVGISAGAGILISIMPQWQPYTLPICLVILLILTVVNLRGLRDTGAVFSIPTYLYIVSLLAAMAWGLTKIFMTNGHPLPVAEPPKLLHSSETVTLWLLLKTFSSGCTAMTGIEAVSNGVTAFKDPKVKTARTTLTVIIVILLFTLISVAYLCKAFGIGATIPGEKGYESVLSQLVGAIAGKGWFYFISMGSIILALAFQANTAFTGFPILCRTIAQDSFLPHSFVNRGRRLVYSLGTYVLAFFAGALLIIFGGITDKLIPLFAVGAFLAFTFSQAGMVEHWRKSKEKHARISMIVNGLGALVTGITTIIIIIAKFTEGAWITLVLIPCILILMKRVNRHYRYISRVVDKPGPISDTVLEAPIVIIPTDRWDLVTYNAVRFGLALSKEVIVVHVKSDEEDSSIQTEWKSHIEIPARKMKLPVPQLVVIKSPYRFVITPILDYVSRLELEHPKRQIAVIVPTLVEKKWYYCFLHQWRAQLLTSGLLLKGKQRIIINVPWYLKK